MRWQFKANKITDSLMSILAKCKERLKEIMAFIYKGQGNRRVGTEAPQLGKDVCDTHFILEKVLAFR